MHVEIKTVRSDVVSWKSTGNIRQNKNRSHKNDDTHIQPT